MRNLKTAHQNKYYRYNNGVIYNITTVKPTKEDYITSEDLNLPYLLVTYGYYTINDSGEITSCKQINYTEKLYLDSYIEVGDYIDATSKKVAPYINNDEDDNEPSSYMLIHEQEIEDMMKKYVINGSKQETIIAQIPYYSREEYSTNNPWKVSPRIVTVINGTSTEQITVNCICKVELKNDYKKNGNNFNSYTTIKKYKTQYETEVKNIVNNYCKTIAKEMIEDSINLETSTNEYNYDGDVVSNQPKTTSASEE